MHILNKRAIFFSVTVLFLFGLAFLVYEKKTNKIKQDTGQKRALKLEPSVKIKAREPGLKMACDYFQIRKLLLSVESSEKQIIFLKQEYKNIFQIFLKKMPSIQFKQASISVEDNRRTITYQLKSEQFQFKNYCNKILKEINNRLALLKLKQSIFRRFFSFLKQYISEEAQFQSKVSSLQLEILKTKILLKTVFKKKKKSKKR